MYCEWSGGGLWIVEREGEGVIVSAGGEIPVGFRQYQVIIKTISRVVAVFFVRKQALLSGGNGKRGGNEVGFVGRIVGRIIYFNRYIGSGKARRGVKGRYSYIYRARAGVAAVFYPQGECAGNGLVVFDFAHGIDVPVQPRIAEYL